MDTEGNSDTDATVRARVELTTETDTDAERHERLARHLRAELAQLDVESVAAVRADPSPAGAKASDPVTLGAVSVAMSASGGALTAVIETLRDGLGRQSGQHRISVSIDGDSIDLERASADQQQQVIAAFPRRHSLE
jgi:hypothetical protein